MTDPHVLRFGPFALDLRTGELQRDGVAVPLAPQPAKLLVALARRRGELVSRDEIQREVWGDDTFVDFERGLNFCVLQARTALGDDAKNPRYIQTLPKRGYRFIAMPIAVPPPRRFTRLAAAATALLPLLFLSAAQKAPRATEDARVALAVLPFENLSGADDEHFSDGMTDELITHLGGLDPHRLAIVARTSILGYRKTTKRIRDIGHELTVDYIVAGTVRRENDHVRVTAQLIATDDETNIWTEAFDRSSAGALAIQRDVATRIAQALKLRLIPDQRGAGTTKIPAAHEAYLRGRYLIHQRKTAAIEEGAAELRKAIALDPRFALAHVALADALHDLTMRGRIPPRQAAAEIRRASDAALASAPTLAQSHATAAMLHFWYDWNWTKAEESYRRAIDLNPSEVGALHDHGWLLITRGARDEGLAQIRRAQELDPVSPRANAHVAWAYIYTGRYDLAIAEARRALELSPEFEEAYWCLEEAYMLSGNYDAALDARQKRLAMMGHEPVLATNARAFLIDERTRTADRMQVDAQSARNPYRAAVAFALAGRTDRAIEWLERAKEQGSVNMPLAGVDPKLRSLHRDPRFTKLLRSIGVTGYHPGP